MGHKIVRQPNGLYALWSDAMNCFVLLDVTPEEIVRDLTTTDEWQNRQRVKEVVTMLKKGEKPYREFTLTWKQCLKRIQEDANPVGIHSMILKKADNLMSKEEARAKLNDQREGKMHHLWLHVPSGRAIPEKPEDATKEDWRRITAWFNAEEDDEE